LKRKRSYFLGCNVEAILIQVLKRDEDAQGIGSTFFLVRNHEAVVVYTYRYTRKLHNFLNESRSTAVHRADLTVQMVGIYLQLRLAIVGIVTSIGDG